MNIDDVEEKEEKNKKLISKKEDLINESMLKKDMDEFHLLFKDKQTELYIGRLRNFD